MSTKNHTPVPTGSAANASVINGPLGQLDAAMGDLATLTTTAKSDLVSAINELDATKQDAPTSQSANLVYASPSGAAGVPGFRALAVTDLPVSGATPGTFTKVTVNNKGLVTNGASTISTTDISDLTAFPLDTLGAPTDNTNKDASISAHGLMPKLANDVTKFFSGLGSWVKWACGIKYNGSGAYTPRAAINFTGAGVSVQDDPANDAIKVTISGIAGGTQALSTLTDVSLASPVNLEALIFDQASLLWKNQNIASIVPTGHVVQDEGTNLTNRPSLNFAGNGVEVTDNGVNNRSDVTITVPVKATGAEITPGTDDAKFATPKALADAGITGSAASTTTQGKVELATAAETLAGTDTARAVTPKGMKDAGIVPVKMISGIPHRQFWIAGAKPTKTNGCAEPAQIEMGTNKNVYDYLAFDKDVTEKAYVNVAMPEDYTGGDIYFKPYWLHPATTTNFGVAWGLQAVSFGNDDALNAAQGTGVLVVDTGGTTSDLWIGDLSAAVTIGGTPAAGKLVNFVMYRKHDDAGDNLGVDAFLHGILVWYPVE